MKNLANNLKEGDTVALFASSSGLSNAEVLIKEYVSVLESFNLNVEVLDCCYKKDRYISGSDSEKLEQLHYAFSNPSIDAIFCIRGGYGVSRYFDKLDFDLIKANPKIICGFSDVTGLLNVIYDNTGLVTFHAPMLSYFNDKTSVDAFFKMIKGEVSDEIVSFDPVVTINEGVAVGELMGGNLSLITSAIGTKQEFSFENKILFFEEVGEVPYRIERQLIQLIRNKDFSKVKGIIIGNFDKCEDGDINEIGSVSQIIEEFLKPLNIPIISNFSFGHQVPFQTFPVGALVTLDATNKKLFLNENVVKEN